MPLSISCYLLVCNRSTSTNTTISPRRRPTRSFVPSEVWLTLQITPIRLPFSAPRIAFLRILVPRPSVTDQASLLPLGFANTRACTTGIHAGVPFGSCLTAASPLRQMTRASVTVMRGLKHMGHIDSPRNGSRPTLGVWGLSTDSFPELRAYLELLQVQRTDHHDHAIKRRI